MGEPKLNFEGVRITDAEAKLLNTLKKKIRAKTKSEVFRVSLVALAREQGVTA